jgi:hypothetical protein
MIALDFIPGGCTGQDYGEDFQLTDAARNQLGVLRTEVEDYDGLLFHGQFCPNRGEV